MSKIERKNLKIFAENAANTGQFGSEQTGTKITTQDPETVQALSAWGTGWANAVIGGSKLPPMEELQATTFVPTYHLAYLFQEGIAEWNAETKYHTGSWVKSGQQIYASLVDDNVNNALTDETKWRVGVSLSNGFDTANIPVWTAGTYNVGDLVHHNGINWYCDRNTSTDEPSFSSAEWYCSMPLEDLMSNVDMSLGGFAGCNNTQIQEHYATFYKVGRYLISGTEYYAYRLNVDGSVLAKGTEGYVVASAYKELEKIGAAGADDITLKDFRGLFPRSSGGNSTSVGEVQDDATAKNGLSGSVSVSGAKSQFNHAHILDNDTNNWRLDSKPGAIPTGGSSNIYRLGVQSYNFSGNFTGSGNLSINGDTETRPSNFSQGCWGVFILVPVADIP